MLAAEQGQELPKGDAKMIGLETIARLYFPELKDETKVFVEMHQLLVHEGRKLRTIFLTPGRRRGEKT